MAEEFSPEEKLLRLIRGEKKQKDKPSPEKTGFPKGSEPPPPGIKNMKREPRTTQVVGDEWRYLKIINTVLIIILIVTISFFIFDLVGSKFKQPVLSLRHEPQIINREVLPTTHELSDAGGEAQSTPFSSYAESIGKRELFKPLQSETPTEKVSGTKSESISDKLKDLSLIGIIAGEKPQAVIEDKKNQKTYFLYKGQIVNQMIVEEILEDRIIFDFDGEKYELTL